jgi:hypothetical protein
LADGCRRSLALYITACTEDDPGDGSLMEAGLAEVV